MILRISILCLCVATFMSCGKDQIATDMEIIEQYIADQGLTGVQSLDNGLHYIIVDPGGSEKPTQDDDVTVHYRGYYTDGEEFDSSIGGDPLLAPLIRLIPGWQVGLPLYGKGGSGLLLIPSSLGYGSNPPGSIRKNAVLIFEIEVLDFN